VKKVVIPIAAVVAIALVVCLVPLKDVAYAVTVDYEDTETYYEEEPYEDTENYTVFTQFYYEVVDSFDKEKNGHPCGYVEIKNTDNTSGLFKILFEFSAYYEQGPFERSFYTEVQLYVAPNQSETAMHCEDNIGIAGNWSWNYVVFPAEKIVKEQRTVIKYRQVEKQRTVIKQRQETRYKKVTLLDYLLHYSEQ